jgi:hypothetical protein
MHSEVPLDWSLCCRKQKPDQFCRNFKKLQVYAMTAAVAVKNYRSARENEKFDNMA